MHNIAGRLSRLVAVNSRLPASIFIRRHSTPAVVSFYDDKAVKYAEKSIRPVTLKQLIQFGRPPLSFSTLLELARYTKSELPVRLARRVKALQNLPFIVGTNPYIKSIYKLYFESFESIRSYPDITDEQLEMGFAELLMRLVASHADNIPTLARGFQECRRYMSSKDISHFLDEMIRARIGIRLIAEQHVALHGSSNSTENVEETLTAAPLIGIINMQLNPAKLIRSCANFVRELCDAHYGSSPEVIVDGQTEETSFAYVPVHLEYIVSELLKNSCRATVEFSQKTNRREHPPIVVTVGRGTQYISIRVRDQGGGVPSKDLESIFDYSYTTVPRDDDDVDRSGNILAGVTKMAMQTGLGGPIAGLGYGLPLARIYAEYFGGSMNLVSLHNYGCDVFVKLKQIDESLDNLQI